ncbi:hypothetical protein DFH28DRAFT_901764 [Melampsora americana]|nr:hypothetical protein DFH28DRAFT_901764 [Melampsora americana]
MRTQPRRLKITNLEFRFGPRAGIVNMHRHRFGNMKGDKDDIIFFQGAQGKHCIYGFTGFLALLHYVGRFPFVGTKIKKLLIEGVSRNTEQAILDYFFRRVSKHQALSEVKELRVKFTNSRRAVVYHLKGNTPRCSMRLNLNGLHKKCDGSVQVVNQRTTAETITSLFDFVKLVESASRLPYTADNINRLWVSGMDAADFAEVEVFFTQLEAAWQCFPKLVHLIYLAK